MLRFPTRINISLPRQKISELQRQNASLRETVKSAVNQVFGAVETPEMEGRLETAEEERSQLKNEIEELRRQYEQWKEDFKQEHNGQEPTEDDR